MGRTLSEELTSIFEGVALSERRRRFARVAVARPVRPKRLNPITTSPLLSPSPSPSVAGRSSASGEASVMDSDEVPMSTPTDQLVVLTANGDPILYVYSLPETADELRTVLQAAGKAIARSVEVNTQLRIAIATGRLPNETYKVRGSVARVVQRDEDGTLVDLEARI
jgi:hypothetical protein